VQYTVRDVPARVDQALRRKAREEGKNLAQILRDALAREAGAFPSPTPHHDLDDLAGAWDEDPEFDRAIAAQDQVDEAMWR
jgi:hypothetical protein